MGSLTFFIPCQTHGIYRSIGQSVLQKLCTHHFLILSFSSSFLPSLPSSLQVDLQRSLRSLEKKEKELRMSRASLREKEAELQVRHEESFLGPLHISC